ncbi:CatA-like O-acetyltransferase [Roseateles violae]|uniref:CatA-like O-acetyltransferase n=1 Tax=Roseateles violae TaxID=3058042 RepID=A0ABT8DWK8_9BURK|nr:CatA-like O-acetyltransferase [Pelomonas sp. PFR6]MDN3920581.1 CatA-like O-acetyltransferase [Pelomonas sp. PFR6]
MPIALDLARWPRRAAFDHFSRLAHPYFSVCARVDVTALAARLRRHPGATWFLAYHHAALVAANALPEFRYRLQDGQVLEHERIDGSTTLLRADESFAIVTLPYEPDFGRFVERALPALAAARVPAPGLGELSEQPALLHMTTIPWLDFTSFAHARDGGGRDSVPKLAFGKMVAGADGRRTMALAVEVHHALMDGLHVGRFYAELDKAISAG